MIIRMKMGIAGMFHDDPAGVVAGQVVEIDDDNAKRYIHHGYAEFVSESKPQRPPAASKPEPKHEERAVAPKSKEERAVVEPVVKPEPKPANKPGPRGK